MDQPPKRPLHSMQLCTPCLAALESQRAIVGELGAASTWCPHTQTYGFWHMARVTFEPCGSEAEWNEKDAGFIRFIEQTRAMTLALIERPPGKPS